MDTDIGTDNNAGLYLLEVKNLTPGSTEYIPSYLLINDLDTRKERYKEPLPHNTVVNDTLQVSQSCHEPYQNGNQCDWSPILYNHIQPEVKSLEDSGNNLKKKSGDNHRNDLMNKCNTNINEIGNNANNSKGNIESISVVHYVHIPDRLVPPKALAVLPTALQFRHGKISAKSSLHAYVRFGPLEGIHTELSHIKANDLIANAMASNSPIFLVGKKEDSVGHIDVSDKDKSSWLSLLPLGDESSANVWICEENCQLFGVTVKPLLSRVPLAIGYSKAYTEKYNLPPGLPILDLHEGEGIMQNEKRESAKEDNSYRKKKKTSPRRRHRCPRCFRTFTKLFTLRRHRAQYCDKADEKPDTNKPSPEKPVEITAPPNLEDSRVPSDESFQNFTNSLDFSTYLFDTDRIPPLDMSGGFRSDTEFNPYSGVLKDDSYFASDLGMITDSENVDNRVTNNKVPTKKEEKITILCRHCKNTITKEKNRNHFRECTARRFTCKCRKVFYKKEDFAAHVQKKHTVEEAKAEVEAEETETDSGGYQCVECNLTFKRRGMLVNHSWRKHSSAVTAPLERRVRLFPCGSCRKLYRASAKRDAHARAHHPEAGAKARAAPIEGGRVECAAAACAACPRQYATRAKLLQHVRQCHPDLAPPVKRGRPSALSNENADT